MNNWTVIYYFGMGQSPIKKFIEKLSVNLRSKSVRSLELLEEFGLFTSPKYLKKITGTPLWELRVLGKISVRYLLIFSQRKEIIILNAFVKKTQKLPLREVKKAILRLTSITKL